MSKKIKLALRVKPKQPVQVNKPVVLTIVGMVVFVVLLAIIKAFHTAETKPKSNSAIKVAVDKPLEISREVKELPSSYSDVQGIKKYLTTDSKSDEVAQLQMRLNEMESAYRFLKQQLSNVQQSNTSRVVSDPKTEQAKSSSLVFAGLGSGVDNLMGGAAAGSRFGRGRDLPGQRTAPGGQQQDAEVVVTPQQAEYFDKQAENIQKAAVMKASDPAGEIYDLHKMVKPASKYLLQAGTIVPAALITGIDTTLAGTVVAQVRQNLYDTVTGQNLLIPKGSKLLGEYISRPAYGQRRVMLVFNRIIRPDGSSILLSRFHAADLMGHSGVVGDVDNHWAKVLGAATISTLMSFGAGAAADSVSNANREYRSSIQNAILGGGQNISAVGQRLAGRAMSIPPTITLPAGYQFVVVIKKDVVLKPYKSRR